MLLPEGMTLVPWSEQRATQFFEVYQDAFRERPRFPGWSEDTWRHNFTDYPDFRADLSLLAMEGPEGVVVDPRPDPFNARKIAATYSFGVNLKAMKDKGCPRPTHPYFSPEAQWDAL